ncbi:STAS domain-containing protein [Pseudomonas sp. zfem005]|uniref:STAS domain-containing protein n=1 Tax=Pseudomonas sp. zfem005 TaxID=3078200 RepID=UPI00292802C2|nr:STAS domain-containing protein [Pseudomonas sp. zfem005]MDU9414775.1 STAS domain-containing protein [Pseudomonas sp. zfem005]
MSAAVLADLLKQNEKSILDEWMAAQRNAGIRTDLIDDRTVQENSRELLRALTAAIAESGDDIQAASWKPVRSLLERLSQAQSRQGFTPSETATFVLSLKEPLFQRIQDRGENAIELIWTTTRLLDKLGLYSMQAFMAGRETVIREQQESMLELSTPVVQLWKGVLAIPLIGSLDSNRTQVVMEALLQKIVETESDIAIIDITGVPTVDTMVAQHLLKTITAAKLMGAKCIISGIRPQIAATIVHLGVELGDVLTKASLADAFQLALKELNVRLVSSAR